MGVRVTYSMEINSGIGIGKIKFGIPESELISQLGEPDKIEEEEYVIDSGYWYRMYYYSNLGLEFTFDKEDNYRLGTISVADYGYKLLGKDLFNEPITTVKNFLSLESSEIPKHEDFTNDDTGSRECVDYDTLGIMLWFKSGNLTEIECSYLFEQDGETEIWPS